MRFELHHNDGTDSRYPDSERDAIRLCGERYGDDLAIGAWDSSTPDSERRLVWQNDDDASNDDGSKAVAEIIRRK